MKVEYKLFTVLGGKFKFQSQDRDLEYYFGDLTNPFHFLKKSHLYYYYGHEKGDKNARQA